MEAEAALAAFKETANVTLEMKTDEVVSANQSALEAGVAALTAESEVARQGGAG